ncbi:MAG: hypothetical protein KKF85_11135 [Gammaproteobacteria bacterium]|nr:hypothetical protein [Rhodocyclaceae bacterium]MBU3907870.1 hypothetical protein [Gammaproteobacteria bacterium]MBU3987913.1 hypothetical protein [Gammaproteobacteria bacterium]MBU4005893.1 hypothetical protein [Gammaproteobacteria bacterium]MBU4095964.1 hypothetical protein [Gammaproteobacteria bacterium]
MKRLVRRVLVAMAVVSPFPVAIPTAFAAQEVAPPEAQAWIDIATFSGMGGMGGMGAMGGNPMSALGAMFGGKSGSPGTTTSTGNTFGNTRTMGTGRWVDVTVRTRANPGLEEAQQAVPTGFISPALELKTPKNAPPPPLRDDEELREETEKPKGRLLLYWGCGPTIRQGQPRVLDAATASIDDYAKFFVARRATQRGAHSAVGRPVWPNPVDSRMVPPQASLVGEHAFTGKGIPDGFRFKIPLAQDLMPPLVLEQTDRSGATDLGWNAIATARAYFVAAMGSNAKEDMVMWTSSELADTGFGLIDYQTNAAVDRWLKEKVLLTPQTTKCTVPKGVFGENGAMLRLIAYGDELNLAHPPRPKDPKAKWEPVWAVKLRVKAVTNGFLGMAETGMPSERGEVRRDENKPQAEGTPGMPSIPQPMELLKGLFGR